MSNPSKKKGTKFETTVVKYLLDAGITAKRQPLKGAKDEGDIICDINNNRIVIECKHRKGFSRSMIDEFIAQTRAEVFNSQAHYGILIIKLDNKPIKSSDCFFISHQSKWKIHFFLDELVDGLKELCSDEIL